MTMTRCAWVANEPLYQHYHDHEWGVAIDDDRLLFECNYTPPHGCHSERSEESPSISGDSSPQKARLRMTKTGGRVVTK